MRRTLITLTTTVALMAGTAFADGLTDMTEAERSAFRAEVRQYLLDNPEVLMEAMEVLQSREAEKTAANEKLMLSELNDSLMNDPNSWVGGNPDGDITVVEFMDYRCSYCRKAYAEVAELVKRDGNIRFVVKEFPILGEESVAASRFAIATRILHGDDAYAKVHDALITLRGNPDSETLGLLAVKMGYEAQPILDMMSGDQVNAVLAANHALGDKMDITGTPTFVVDQSLLRGYLPLQDMIQVVAEQRAG